MGWEVLGYHVSSISATSHGRWVEAGGCRWSQAQGPQQKLKQRTLEDCVIPVSMDNLGGWGGDRSAGGRLSTLERQDPDSARNLGISVCLLAPLWEHTLVYQTWTTLLLLFSLLGRWSFTLAFSLSIGQDRTERGSSLGVVKAICKHPCFSG